MSTLTFPTRSRSFLPQALLGVMAFSFASVAHAETDAESGPRCSIVAPALDHGLARTNAQLARGTLTIVAIGSSSTEGAGATSSATTYPSRLEALLGARFPGVAIRVVNRGIGGEEETEMLARFERDVFAEKPDLVLWQVASNAIVRKRHLSIEERLIRTGIERLKASGADVVLVDPQYTRAVLEQPLAVPTVDLIAAEARRASVGTFRRFDLMRDWHESQGVPFEAFSIEDGLHMNDWGYDCFARNLASAIVQAATPSLLASAQAEDAR